LAADPGIDDHRLTRRADNDNIDGGGDVAATGSYRLFQVVRRDAGENAPRAFGVNGLRVVAYRNTGQRPDLKGMKFAGHRAKSFLCRSTAANSSALSSLFAPDCHANVVTSVAQPSALAACCPFDRDVWFDM